ncbi:MAG: XdhC family protein [Clostridium sp.]|uniref:XdhC family protein n=1 Tax=Clostridium sp. TaxID=1506 RepID=UPI002FC6D6C2
MDYTLLEEINDNVKNGKEVALSIITKACGSSPRGEGTMMGVLRDGTILGTIGGGALENEIKKESVKCIKLRTSRRFTFNLNETNTDLNMTCGGEIEIYIKILLPKRKLLIVGGGHIALPLQYIANIVGYDVVIFEDREEYCNYGRFKVANELILGDIRENLSVYPINNQCSIVIITRGHIHDEIALKTILDTPANYIGMIGSKTKVNNLMQKLIAEGYSKIILDKIYSPIGLNLGGETPEDIALGIMAEISLLNNNGSLEHKKFISKNGTLS